MGLTSAVISKREIHAELFSMVFHTFELLENILLQTDEQTVVSLRRVNSTFKQTIERSTRLDRMLFLPTVWDRIIDGSSPPTQFIMNRAFIPDNLGYTLRFNPLLFKQHLPTKICGVGGATPLTRSLVLRLRIHPKKFGAESDKLSSAFCGRMFATMPPICRLVIFTRPWATKSTFHVGLNFKDGLLIDDVLEGIRKIKGWESVPEFFVHCDKVRYKGGFFVTAEEMVKADAYVKPIYFTQADSAEYDNGKVWNKAKGAWEMPGDKQ